MQQASMTALMKSKYLYLLLVSILLAACSLSSESDTNAGSDDALVGIMVAQTSTQQTNAQPEGTLGGRMVAQTPTQQTNVQLEDTLMGTMVAQTPTQRVNVQSEDTPQPTRQEPVDEAPVNDAVPTDQVDQTYGIPGLNASDLVDRLFGFGFDCSEPEIQGSQHIRDCDFGTSEYQYSVTLWGSTPDTVDLIEAVAFYFGDLDYAGLTAIVFGMIAEVPYADADPESARAWVEAAIPDIMEIGDEVWTDFGGVRYYLYAFPSAHVLEIGGLLE
jgi:hypothetical protein